MNNIEVIDLDVLILLIINNKGDGVIFTIYISSCMWPIILANFVRRTSFKWW